VKNILATPMLLVFACLLCGLYGALHDQISYTVSPEYFTAFKFYQFRIDAAYPERLGAAIVGWRGSWWMGPLIAPPLLLVAAFVASKDYIRASLQAFAIVAGTTFLVGCGALLYACLFMTAADVPFISLPPEVRDRDAFIRVGVMHTFSYLGGFAGILTGIGFLIRRRLRSEKSPNG
jgi:hypothetical protein